MRRRCVSDPTTPSSWATWQVRAARWAMHRPPLPPPPPMPYPLTLHPHHQPLAAVQLETGRVDESLVTFDRALELLPDFPDCLSNMGNALKLKVRGPPRDRVGTDVGGRGRVH
jgi:hypothetical protein